MTVAQAADYLTCSVDFLNRARIQGRGPSFLKLGSAVRYERDDLDAWLASCRRRSTSEQEAA